MCTEYETEFLLYGSFLYLFVEAKERKKASTAHPRPSLPSQRRTLAEKQRFCLRHDENITAERKKAWGRKEK